MFMTFPPAAGTNLDSLVQSFAESDIAGDIHDEIQQAMAVAREANGRNGLVIGNSTGSAIGRGYAFGSSSSCHNGHGKISTATHS